MAAVELTEEVQMSLVYGYITFFDRKIPKVISFELFFLVFLKFFFLSCWIILITKIQAYNCCLRSGWEPCKS